MRHLHFESGWPCRLQVSQPRVWPCPLNSASEFGNRIAHAEDVIVGLLRSRKNGFRHALYQFRLAPVSSFYVQNHTNQRRLISRTTIDLVHQKSQCRQPLKVERATEDLRSIDAVALSCRRSGDSRSSSLPQCVFSEESTASSAFERLSTSSPFASSAFFQRQKLVQGKPLDDHFDRGGARQ